MTRAFRSTLDLSSTVPGGLLMRQTHHWAALVFVAAMVVHLLRVFFTAAYRRPRELTWLLGVGLLAMGVLEGFAGYSLPDDLLSGMGLAIAYGVALSIPLLGGSIGALVWGGAVPRPRGDREPPLHPARVRPARRHGRADRRAPGARRAPQAHPVRRARAGARTTWSGRRCGPATRCARWACSSRWRPCSCSSAASCRSTPSGSGARTSSTARPTAPSPTGTWAGSSAACGSCRRSRSRSSAARSCPTPSGAASPSPGSSSRCWRRGRSSSRACCATARRHDLLDRPREHPWRTAFGVAFFSWVALIFVAGAADRLFYQFGISYTSQVHLFRALTLIAPPRRVRGREDHLRRAAPHAGQARSRRAGQARAPARGRGLRRPRRRAVTTRQLAIAVDRESAVHPRTDAWGTCDERRWGVLRRGLRVARGRPGRTTAASWTRSTAVTWAISGARSRRAPRSAASASARSPTARSSSIPSRA